MGKEQFLVQAEANLSFCHESQVYLAEWCSVYEADW